MSDRHLRLSRQISHALRHQPERYGLQLDSAGWVAIESLIAALAESTEEWQDLSADDIHAMAAAAAKERFEISGTQIRALYGHSTSDKIRKDTAEPPTYLFHGTTPAALLRIAVEGLKPMRRQYVHLSPDQETATVVAARRTATPQIIRVLAGQAHAAGIAFYIGNDRIWLSDAVAPEYLVLPGR